MVYVFICFLFFSEQEATLFRYSINPLDSVNDVLICVFAVRQKLSS